MSCPDKQAQDLGAYTANCGAGVGRPGQKRHVKLHKSMCADTCLAACHCKASGPVKAGGCSRNDWLLCGKVMQWLWRCTQQLADEVGLRGEYESPALAGLQQRGPDAVGRQRCTVSLALQSLHKQAHLAGPQQAWLHLPPPASDSQADLCRAVEGVEAHRQTAHRQEGHSQWKPTDTNTLGTWAAYALQHSLHMLPVKAFKGTAAYA